MGFKSEEQRRRYNVKPKQTCRHCGFRIDWDKHLERFRHIGSNKVRCRGFEEAGPLVGLMMSAIPFPTARDRAARHQADRFAWERVKGRGRAGGTREVARGVVTRTISGKREDGGCYIPNTDQRS